MSLTIRPIVKEDWETIASWVGALGWNPGIKDGECMKMTDPDGMFMAELDGLPVGCNTAMVYDSTYGFLGGLVVNPEVRSKGYGTILTNHSLQYMGNRNIGLDAMATTRKWLAQTYGFINAYLHIRYEGVITGARTSSSIVPLADVPFASICSYDAACFPVPREKFLRIWLEAYGSGGFASMRNNKLAGFGVLRQALHGFRIGPILADDADTAEEIMLALGTLAGESKVAIDVPEINSSAVKLAEKFGLKRGFDTVRMYSKVVPDLPMERVFGIASYEFG
jgi:GNAT superfamily N-acetyltransferase